MAKLIAVCKYGDGFAVKNLTVKSMDMNEIVKVCNQHITGWGFDNVNFELFSYDPKMENPAVVAQHTGRGWVRISTFVKNWEKYATPSWVKKVKFDFSRM